MRLKKGNGRAFPGRKKNNQNPHLREAFCRERKDAKGNTEEKFGKVDGGWKRTAPEDNYTGRPQDKGAAQWIPERKTLR